PDTTPATHGMRNQLRGLRVGNGSGMAKSPAGRCLRREGLVDTADPLPALRRLRARGSIGLDIATVDPSGDEFSVLRGVVPDLAPAIANLLLLLPFRLS